MPLCLNISNICWLYTREKGQFHCVMHDSDDNDGNHDDQFQRLVDHYDSSSTHSFTVWLTKRKSLTWRIAPIHKKWTRDFTSMIFVRLSSRQYKSQCMNWILSIVSIFLAKKKSYSSLKYLFFSTNLFWYAKEEEKERNIFNDKTNENGTNEINRK